MKHRALVAEGERQDAEVQALQWTEFLYAFGHPWEGRHLHGRHMKGYVDEAFAMQAEMTAGFFPGGRHLALEVAA